MSRFTQQYPERIVVLDTEDAVEKAVVASLKDKKTKEEMAKIVKVITEHSTIMPFRWSTRHYFTCFFCGTSFENITNLKRHTQIVHETDKKVTQKYYYLSRIKLDVSEISCKSCPKTIDDLESFFNHISYAHEVKFNRDLINHFVCFKLTDDDLTCLHCGERFSFFGTLLMHDNRYHNESKTFACNVCGEAFISKYILSSHIYYKHDEKRCKICNEVFKTAFALMSHNQKVHDVDKLKCPECNEILGSKYLQKQHRLLVHGVGGKPLVCEICSRSFVTNKTLRDHVARVHKKEKSIACEICGFKVFSRAVLTLHMVKHSEARPFVCEKCKKSFRRKKTLETHMKLHNNFRPYECSDCDKSFVQNGNLRKHIRISHSDSKVDKGQRINKKIELGAISSESRDEHKNVMAANCSETDNSAVIS